MSALVLAGRTRDLMSGTPNNQGDTAMRVNQLRNYGLLAALAALAGPGDRRTSVLGHAATGLSAEQKAARKNGNRTAPAHIQSALIARAAAKRARRAASRIAA